MKKMFKNIFYLFLLLILVNACTSVKEGLSGAKKESADEFLVEKKNPLTVPPEFDKLPKPSDTKNNENKDEGDSLENILTKKKFKITKSSEKTLTDKSLEKSILEKIKSN